MKFFVLNLYFLNIVTLFPSLSQTLTRGPYLQMATPASMQIRWRTSTPTSSKVSYGTSAANLAGQVTDATLKTDHIINLTNLQANTQYFYSIGTSTQTLQGDATNFFYTMPPFGTQKKIRIWATGDSGFGSPQQINTLNQYQNYVGNGYTDVWLLMGDNAYVYGLDNEYQTGFFNVYQSSKVMKQTVLFPAPGNHDYYIDLNSRITKAAPYYDIFSMPTQGQSGGVASNTETFYSYDYGDVHFISLDSYGYEQGQYRMWEGPQLQWLQQDLAANTKKWTIVYFHHPPYTMGSHNSDTETELAQIRQGLVPVFDQYKVDLVLCGHSHNYERTRLIKGHTGMENTFSAQTHNLSSSSGKYDGSTDSCPYVKNSNSTQNDGVMYVVAGTAGFAGLQQASWPHEAMYTAHSTAGSVVVEIEGNRLDSKFISETGSILDQFTIMKDVNQKKNITALPNQEVNLSASWFGTYKWQQMTSNARNVSLTATKSGTFEVSDDKNCLKDTYTLNVKPCVVGSFQIPQSDGNTRTATLECNDPNGLTHYYDTQGNLLLSLKKRTEQLGKLSDGSLKITQGGNNALTTIKPNAGNHVFFENGLVHHNRLVSIESKVELPANERIEATIYIPENELKALQDSSKAKSVNDVLVLKSSEESPLFKPSDSRQRIPLSFTPNDRGIFFYLNGDSLTASTWKHQKQDKYHTATKVLAKATGVFALASPVGVAFAPSYFDKISAKFYPTGDSINVSTIAYFDASRLVLERSTNGQKYDSLQSVPAKKIAGIQRNSYSFWDFDPPAGEVYYRIKAVGKTSKIGYSTSTKVDVPILSVEPSSKLTVYPNPVAKTLYFTESIWIESYDVVDINGKIHKTDSPKKVINSVDFEGVGSGIYLLKLKTKEGYQSLKILKE
jgi:hypothetical protein